MSVSLTAVLEAAEAPRPAAKSRRRHSTVVIDTRPDAALTGADLMREIRTAMMSVPGVRRLEEHEQDAVAQAVALTVLSGADRLRGRPAAVLAWIDRCERFPTLMARAGDTVPRGAIGRNLLAARVRSVMAQRSDWQDTAERHRTRRELVRDTGPMIRTVADVTADEVSGRLALSIAAPAPDVFPADVPDLARAVASRLTTDPVTARRITARLVQAMAVAGGDDPAVALASLAEGRTLNAVRVDAARGADALAALDLAPADLAGVIRDAAHAAGLARSAVLDRVELDGPTRAAAEAVASLARDGGAWDQASIGTARSLPGWQDRPAPADAAPFPALSRPDQPAPVSAASRGRTVRYGAPTVTLPRRQRRGWTRADQDALFARAW